MKKIIFGASILFLFSCGENNGSKNAEGSSTEISDAERAKLLAEKKERLENESQSINEAIDFSKIEWGTISLSPFIPPYKDLGDEGTAILENKLNNILAKSGTGGYASNPTFVLIPAINLTTKNITSTAPTLYSNTYELTFYVANMNDGTVFGTSTQKFKGVGESPLKAFINGMESVEWETASLKKMLEESKEKIISFYEKNCDQFITEAKNEASQKKYNEALVILKSIPHQVSCYNKIGGDIDKYFKLSLSQQCSELLSQMKGELGKQSDLGGFNEKAMAYYSLIPTDAPCSKDAQTEYKSYLKKLDPKAKQQWEKDEKEFNLRKDKQNQSHEYEMTKAELESKTAIEGQTALLDKYKKDAEYDKLPWLRKLVHLGEWDPFDATSRINK